MQRSSAQTYCTTLVGCGNLWDFSASDTVEDSLLLQRTTGLFFGETRRQETSGGITVSENRYEPGQTTPHHAHETALFYGVLDGVCHETTAGTTSAHPASTLAFLAAGEAHTTRWSSDAPGRCFHVEVSPAFREAHRIGALPSVGSARYAGGAPPALLTRRLHAELVAWNPDSALIMEGLTLELLNAVRGDGAQRRIVAPAGSRLSAVEARLREQTHAVPPSLVELAELAGGVHPTYLLRSFRRVYHESPGAFARRLRIEQACRRLRARGLVSLAELAAELGFADQSHFTRTFKRIVGMSPGAYRRAHIGDKADFAG